MRVELSLVTLGLLATWKYNQERTELVESNTLRLPRLLNVLGHWSRMQGNISVLLCVFIWNFRSLAKTNALRLQTVHRNGRSIVCLFL